MKKKEEILLEKLNIKDYKVEFEEILEQKNFSSDIKNFLLSLLYKIENSYEDYKLVKVIPYTKQQFVEEYIKIIEKKCNQIELIKPTAEKTEELENSKYKCNIERDKGKITALYNYKTFLYELYVLNYQSYNTKNEMLFFPINEMLEIGSSIDKEEIIRDFDGWSWHLDYREISNLEYNLIYQSAYMILEKDNFDFDKSFEELTGTNFKNVYMLICKLVLLIYVKNTPAKKKEILLKEEKLQRELDEISNKTQYLEKIISKKKSLEGKIKKIDELLNNVESLKKAYIAENKKLDENEKIFSISDYEEMKILNRSEFLVEIQNCNRRMEPKNYINSKNLLLESIDLIEFIKKADLFQNIIKLQKLILLILSEKIKLCNSKKEIVNYIYKFRYYKHIPLPDGTEIKNCTELQEYINKFEELLYSKACELKTILQLSVIPKTNAQVLADILDTKIIRLEDIELIFNAINYEINIEVNDENNLDKKLNYDRIEGLSIKFNNRIKLFL
jgi:hypothetical protein